MGEGEMMINEGKGNLPRYYPLQVIFGRTTLGWFMIIEGMRWDKCRGWRE